MKKYVNLRPTYTKNDIFFANLKYGKCGIQLVGINTIGNLTKTIPASIGYPIRLFTLL